MKGRWKKREKSISMVKSRIRVRRRLLELRGMRDSNNRLEIRYYNNSSSSRQNRNNKKLEKGKKRRKEKDKKKNRRRQKWNK